MINEDIKELRKDLASLPTELDAYNQHIFAEFGQLCAKKYIPALMRTAGLNRETPEFDPNSCEMCYWTHQEVRLGCGQCSDKSEFISMFSPEATKRHKQLMQEVCGSN